MMRTLPSLLAVLAVTLTGCAEPDPADAPMGDDEAAATSRARVSGEVEVLVDADIAAEADREGDVDALAAGIAAAIEAEADAWTVRAAPRR